MITITEEHSSPADKSWAGPGPVPSALPRKGAVAFIHSWIAVCSNAPGLPPFFSFRRMDRVAFPMEFWAKQMNVLCRSPRVTPFRWRAHSTSLCSSVACTLGKKEGSHSQRWKPGQPAVKTRHGRESGSRYPNGAADPGPVPLLHPGSGRRGIYSQSLLCSHVKEYFCVNDVSGCTVWKPHYQLFLPECFLPARGWGRHTPVLCPLLQGPAGWTVHDIVGAHRGHIANGGKQIQTKVRTHAPCHARLL